MNQNHLSAAEVAMFREESLSSRSIEIGRHLLTCKECRAKLPSVTKQEFRNCIIDSEVVNNGKVKLTSRLFPNIRLPRLPIARPAVFAGLTILLLAGLYLVRVRSGFIDSEPIIAKNEVTSVPLESVPPESRSVVEPPPAASEQPVSNEPEKKDEYSERRKLPKRMSLSPGRKPVGGAPAVRTAETRGDENPCSGGATVSLESNTDGKQILLKWNPVKGAASYDIYISDLDENLIDHFESDSQTQYRSTVELEPERTYRWKLIITLRNGNKIVGPPQTLKPGGVLNSHQKKVAVDKQRGTFAIRCVGAK
ncbi:MAG TPA: hypothetical protein PKD26_16585 [Pyrinomonadaceae bacterium]|nr:hypothetical protein [Pyrinomonadaceae bacterium]